MSPYAWHNTFFRSEAIEGPEVLLCTAPSAFDWIMVYSRFRVLLASYEETAIAAAFTTTAKK
jgi:hypothetical protein